MNDEERALDAYDSQAYARSRKEFHKRRSQTPSRRSILQLENTVLADFFSSAVVL